MLRANSLITWFVIVIFSGTLTTCLNAQNPSSIMEVEGVIKLNEQFDTSQMAGTIMYLGYDFWGRTNDGIWRSFTEGDIMTMENNIGDQIIIPTTNNRNTIIGDFSGKNLITDMLNLSGSSNTLIGFNSGQWMTSGSTNTFLGTSAGRAATTAFGNTYLGATAGELNTDGNQNTFIGRGAGYNTSQSNNIAIGDLSLGDSKGQENVAIGNKSARNAGSNNVSIGHHTGSGDSTYNNSVVIGAEAGMSLDVDDVVFVGYQAGKNNSTGTENTFIGHQSGLSVTEADRNTYIGYYSGIRNLTGNDNTHVGYLSGENNRTFGNTLIGGWTGRSIINGWNNTVLGYTAQSSENGAGNTILGARAGNEQIGNFNIIIGYDAGQSVTGSNKLVIETAGFQDPDNATPLIYGEFDNDMVQINGSMHISEFARLIPQESEPSNPEEGTVYYDAEFKALRVWNGVAWRNLQYE